MTFEYLLPGSQKASGPADINHRMVIASENTMCRPLCKLFNLSLKKICLPSIWKLANVTAVFKKSITSNNRPISLFGCVSIIFERTVFKYVLTISVEISIEINFSLAFSLDIPLHIS